MEKVLDGWLSNWACLKTQHASFSEEFENGDCFTLKTYQMFAVHTTLEEFVKGDFR